MISAFTLFAATKGAPAASAGTDGITRVKMPNGATLLVKEDPAADVVSLNIWVEAGSIDEKPDERGMAHLIEHMIFKGTKKRGVGEISREVEAAGGYLNAFTSFEHTCYYVVLPSDRILQALDVQFDAYMHSSFDAGELAKEKEVVFEEMRMRQDDPWSWSWELLFKNTFTKNPYHWPVIGDPKILKTVPREKLLAYYKSHYLPKNTVVVVVGNVKSAEVVKWVGNHFGKAPSPAVPTRRFQADAEPKGLKLTDEAGDLTQTYASLGFPSVAIHHPDAPALEVLEAILSEGASSRLALAIREGTRSADDVSSDHFSGRYGGLFTFQGLTDDNRLSTFLDDLMDVVGKINSQGVEESDLAKVKTRLKASKIFEKQSMDGMAKSLGFWELQGGYEKEDEFIRALEAVSSDEVKRVCARYLQPKRATLVLYRPKGSEKTLPAVKWQKRLEDRLVKSSQAAVKDSAPKKTPLVRMAMPGGGTLLVKERRDLPVVSLGLFFDGGFSDETKGKYGITGLTVKCLLKGSGGMDNAHFSAAVDALAAGLSPVAEKDYWGLTMDVLSPRFDEALRLLAQAVLKPTFDPAEVAKERDLQVAAIKRLPDDPGEYGMLKSDVMTFAGTPYAHTPLGEEADVRKFDASTVRSWYKARLGRRGMTLVVVGDVDAESLKTRLADLLSGLPEGAVPAVKKTIEPRIVGEEFRETMDRKQSTVVLGLRAPHFDPKNYFTYRVMSALLNGMGARLFVELREKRSLAYSVYASHEALARSGIFQAYVGCAPGKEKEARSELVRVLRSLAEGEVTDAELSRAKTYVTGLYRVGLQANRSQMGSFARYEMSGPGAEWVDRYPSEVAKVTKADIKAAAKEVFMSDKATWVILGPSGKK